MMVELFSLYRPERSRLPDLYDDLLFVFAYRLPAYMGANGRRKKTISGEYLSGRRSMCVLVWSKCELLSIFCFLNFHHVVLPLVAGSRRTTI